MFPDPPVSGGITRTGFYVKFSYLFSKHIPFKRFAIANADDMEIKRLSCFPEHDRMWWINSSYRSNSLIKSNQIKSNHLFFQCFEKRGFWIYSQITSHIIYNFVPSLGLFTWCVNPVDAQSGGISFVALTCINGGLSEDIFIFLILMRCYSVKWLVTISRASM